MRGIVRFIASLLLCGVANATTPDVIRVAHQTTHHTVYGTIVTGAISCSATAIAPHALLTATHCEVPADKLFVDEDEVDILGRIRDEYDHTILLVDFTFKHYAPIAETRAQVADEVFMFGNPGGFENLFRKGQLIGFRDGMGRDGSATWASGDKNHDCELVFDLNGYFGDSGSGIFNDKGEIITVVTWSLSKHNEESQQTFVLMSGYAFDFTPEQWLKAKSFMPPVTLSATVHKKRTTTREID